MCDSLSERMIFILWEPIVCELILFPHDSLKKESRERWKQGNREAKRWCRFTAWTGVRGASFFLYNTSNTIFTTAIRSPLIPSKTVLDQIISTDPGVISNLSKKHEAPSTPHQLRSCEQMNASDTSQAVRAYGSERVDQSEGKKHVLISADFPHWLWQS